MPPAMSPRQGVAMIAVRGTWGRAEGEVARVAERKIDRSALRVRLESCKIQNGWVRSGSSGIDAGPAGGGSSRGGAGRTAPRREKATG